MKIFIVEDSALMKSRIAQAVMRIEGLVISGSASDATSAIDGVAASSPDALIVDINLADSMGSEPGTANSSGSGNGKGEGKGNGLTVLRQVKATQPGIKSIVLTNSASSGYRHAALALGADYFLDKSTEFTQLAGILSAWHARPHPTPANP
jgi:two-component system, NarL family, response regulator DevR